MAAEGDVKIEQEGNRGACQKAVYELLPEEKMVMTGNPLLQRGEQQFSGETITFFPGEQRVVIKNKVRGVVFPRENKESKERN